MFWKPAARLALLPLLAAGLFAQGPDTQAAKDDWEEINFEFNSSVLVDGFPSMLRLADLLKTNPTFRVQVEGNTDEIGGKGYNQRLGLARANSVRDFLIKYGAGAGQITVASAADNKPKTKASKRGYNPTDEGRYMNRRVVLTVANGQGQRVGDIGGVGDAIRAINNNNQGGGGAGGAGGPGGGGQSAAARPDCCAETQRKLDDLANKMDRLLNAMNNTADENKKLKDDLDALKKAQDALQAKMDTTSGKVDQTANKVDALPKAPSLPKPATEDGVLGREAIEIAPSPTVLVLVQALLVLLDHRLQGCQAASNKRKQQTR